MTGIGLLHRVDRQAPDRVNGEEIEIGLGRHRFSLRGRQILVIAHQTAIGQLVGVHPLKHAIFRIVIAADGTA